MGGLSGKAKLIESQSNSDGAPPLIVDAGKSLFKSYNNHYSEKDLITAEKIAEAYVKMGYDAVALSGQELLAGPVFIKKLLSLGLPLVSANLSKDWEDINIATHISKTIGDLKIAITAITDFPGDNIREKRIISALNDFVKTLSRDHDMVILLSNLKGKENRSLGQSIQELDIIISSDLSLGKMSPTISGNTLITQTSSRGKYIGKIDIHWENGNHWYNDRLPPIAKLQKQQEALSAKIGRFEAVEGTKPMKKITRLTQQQKRLEVEIERCLAMQTQLEGQKYNKHRLSFLPVRPTKTPVEIQDIVSEITRIK